MDGHFISIAQYKSYKLPSPSTDKLQDTSTRWVQGTVKTRDRRTGPGRVGPGRTAGGLSRSRTLESQRLEGREEEAATVKNV